MNNSERPVREPNIMDWAPNEPTVVVKYDEQNLPPQLLIDGFSRDTEKANVLYLSPGGSMGRPVAEIIPEILKKYGEFFDAYRFTRLYFNGNEYDLTTGIMIESSDVTTEEEQEVVLTTSELIAELEIRISEIEFLKPGASIDVSARVFIVTKQRGQDEKNQELVISVKYGSLPAHRIHTVRADKFFDGDGRGPDRYGYTTPPKKIYDDLVMILFTETLYTKDT